MNTLRKSKLSAFICFFMAFALLCISCNPSSSDLSPQGCSTLNITLSNPSQVANQFESMSEYVRALQYQEGFTTLEEFHEEVYGQNEETPASIAAFEQSLQDYQTRGFEGYLQSRQDLSEELKNYIFTYSNELLSFLFEEQPDLSQFTQFINNQQTLLTSSELCPQDAELMTYYLALGLGYAQFYYQHYYDVAEGSAAFRGCNFFEAIGCGVVATLTAVTASFLASISIITILVDGSEVTPEQGSDLKNLLEAAVLVYVGIDVYQWCCGKEEVEEQECEIPTGGAVRQIGCREFTFRIFGSSTYGATEWMNDNTDPADTITSISSLRFSVPTLGDSSTISALVTCLQDQNTIQVLPFGPEDYLFESNDDLFPLEWITAPPATANYIPNFILPYTVSVNTPSTDQVTYRWSINAPHSINWDAHNAVATIKFKGQGIAKTTVEVLNNCTGERAVLSATTNVQ